MPSIVTRVSARQPGAELFAFAAAAFEKRVWAWGALVIALLLALPVVGAGPSLIIALALVAAIGQANLDAMCGELFGRRRFQRAEPVKLGETDWTGI
jgi:hypothetical protein